MAHKTLGFSGIRRKAVLYSSFVRIKKDRANLLVAKDQSHIDIRKAAVSIVDVIGRKMWLLQLLIGAKDCSTLLAFFYKW
jgi:hypothetical protein